MGVLLRCSILILFVLSVFQTEAVFFNSWDNNNTLVLYYPFDENSTAQGKVLDYSGNGQNGSFQTVGGVESEWFNNSISVNGSYGGWKINTTGVGRPSAINSSYKGCDNRRCNFTLAFWVNTTFDSNTLFNTQNNNDSDGNLGESWAVTFRVAPQRITFYIRNTSNSVANTLTYTNPQWNNFTWQHVTVRMNFTEDIGGVNTTELRIYLNGTEVNKTTFDNENIMVNAQNFLHFGQQFVNPLQKMFIDDVRFYDIALTDGQISNISNRSILSNFTEPIINFTHNGIFTFKTDFDVTAGQTIPLCKNTVVPNCTIRICYPN